MCGRYSFSTSKEKLRAQFGQQLQIEEALEANFNVAPTQKGYVITDAQPQLLQRYAWGLVPHWSKEGKPSGKLINARAEGIASKPSFRLPIRRRRCWVLADSFYEWKRDGGRKIPYRILRRDGQLLVMAGIWEIWKNDHTTLFTYAIITTEPNAEVAPLHNRMPVIFSSPERQNAWLEEDQLDNVLELLQPPPDGTLRSYPVSTQVNSVRNNGPELHQPLSGPADLFS